MLVSSRVYQHHMNTKPKVNRHPVCAECGRVWGEGDDRLSFTKHMVEVHGYKQVGAQVFKSHPCVGCPKPGLYRVGAIAYCKLHLPLAQSRRDWINGELNRGGDDDQQRMMRDRDRVKAFDSRGKHRG